MTQQQELLTKTLIAASEAYYNTGTSQMSDLEYDHKLAELARMEEESGKVLEGSPTQNVGTEAPTGLKKQDHERPALSLDKVKYKNKEDLVKWLKERGTDGVLSYKLDGSTVVATYDNGELTSVVTRGNGITGSVITHNAKYFKGLPMRITLKDHVVVRGEAMMTNTEFEKINTEAGGIYENARNLASATIQMLDANESRKREIIFKAFELVSPEPDNSRDECLQNMGDRLNLLHSLGFQVVPWMYVTPGNVLNVIENIKAEVASLDYPTDGLVLSMDNLKLGWEMGSTGHHPRYSIALKWTDETVETTLTGIEWSVGKTGMITPVALFKPVRLGLGSMVSRASLHNISIMQNMPLEAGNNTSKEQMQIGDKIDVYLANMIIPQVAFFKRNEGDRTPIEIPKVCPVCGHSLRQNEKAGIITLHCDNKRCSARRIGELMNTFGKDGLFIKGLGENQLKDLMQIGLVSDTIDLFIIEHYDNNSYIAELKEKLLSKDGWGTKKWNNLMEAVNEARKTSLQKFLYSLNIPMLGNDLSKKLSKYWGNSVERFVKEFLDVPLEDKEKLFNELTALDGVGTEKGSFMLEWLKEMNENYRQGIKKIKILISQLDFEETAPAGAQTLSGLTFVITGSMHEYKNRDEFTASVEVRGGKVSGSVSKNTSYLVNNDVESSSGKNKKAKDLGIQIISEDEFISKFGK